MRHSPHARLAARLPRRTVRLRLTALYGGLFLAAGTGLLAITNILARSWPWSAPALHVIRRGSGAGTGHPLFASPPAVFVHQAVRQEAHQHAAELNQLLILSAVALAVMAVVSVALGWLVAGRVLRPLREMTAAARTISEDNLSGRLAVSGPSDELKDLGDTIDKLLERLQAAFDAQRNFAANASHELRTPLTLSKTLLQMALTNPRPTLDTYRATCQDVLEAGEHQEQLIEALLTLARSQRGLDHREPFDLAAITRDALRTCQQRATTRGLTVNTSITTAPVLGDERLLQRLATNLIGNAIRYNTPGGQVDIQVTSCGGHPRLKITNTGPLIPADQASRLLQPFQRQPATRAVSDDGLGLGLPIAAAITKAHHATLGLSPGPEGGLNIDITFPTTEASLGFPS